MDPSEIDRHLRALGQAIRTHRQRRGLSQIAATRSWGVSRTWLSELERGHGNPTFGTLVALADAMGLALVDLFRPTDNPPEDTAKERSGP